VSGSGSTSLTFSYTVVEGDQSTTDLEVIADGLVLNGGAAITDADLTGFAGTNPSDEVAVDATRPTLEIGASGLKTIGEKVTFTFTFTEAVSGFVFEDIKVVGVTLNESTFTEVNGVYKVDGTVTGAVNLGVADGVYEDAVGNAGTGDTLTFPVGNTINGTNRNDKVDPWVSGRKYHFQSTDSDDIVRTGKGNDIIKAAGGNDLINAGAGIDKVNAGQGDDTIYVCGKQAVHDRMAGGEDEDTLELIGSTSVTLSGFNAAKSSIEDLVTNGLAINGTQGADKFDFRDLASVEGTLVVNGGGGADRIVGSNFADVLRGGNARDILIGGEGDDILCGGRHGDVYVFAESFGDDTVVDFGDHPSDQDVIKIVGYGKVLAAHFQGWKDNHVELDNVNGKVVITLGEDTITLSGFKDVSNLGFEDFLFV
jgi:Ca2+-binding RTX toxin-like protein